MLVRTNEIYLAYYLAKYFYPPALKECAILFVERAERFFQTDICLKILSEDVKDHYHEALVKNRLMRQGVLKRLPDQKERDANLV